MKPASTVLLIFLAAFISCHNRHRNTYAIRDFNSNLQPYLVKVVSNGIVGFDTFTRYIQFHTTDNELKQLSQSEHPVLRAIAFREMLERPTFNHFELIMNNLDDTAIVGTYAGERGIQYVKISDDILYHGRWIDTISKNKTIEEIIIKHNYLNSAYTKLLNIEPKELYYPYIREMAQRKKNYDEEIGEMDFDKIEYALYALAKFKKSEDIPIIKGSLLSNWWRMSQLSFRLMQEYPNETYLDVYEKFYPGSFYLKICRDQNINDAASFINSIATYKNERSALILNTILSRKPFMPCSTDTNTLKEELIYAIWNNRCNAYSKMIRQVESLVKNYEKNKIELLVEPVKLPQDTSAEPIRW